MRRIWLFLWFVLPAVLFSACNDEDAECDAYAETSGEYWESLAGVYRGKMIANVEGVVLDTLYQQAFIQSDHRNKMTLAIRSLYLDEELMVGTVYFSNLHFSESDGCFLLNAETIQDFGPVLNAKLVLTGTISKGVLDISITTYSNTSRTISLTMNGSWIPEPLSSDATIKKMTLRHPYVVSQPDIQGSTIRFFVSDTLTINDTIGLYIVPRFELAKGATISYPDSLMNFAGKKVVYTVIAADSITRIDYQVRMEKASVVKYNINSWRNYYGWEDPTGLWSSNNGLFDHLKKEGSYKGNYPVTRVKGFGAGNFGVKMETVAVGEGANQRIYAGSFFMGSFDQTMAAPLGGPVYGQMFAGRPIKIKGAYKFSPGSDYYIQDSLAQDITDSCRICAILYEAPLPETILSSKDYLNDPRVVGIADMGWQAGTLQRDFVEFNIYFYYVKAYFPTKRYKMALICSSSKEADRFEGAPGSELVVSDIEVMYNH